MTLERRTRLNRGPGPQRRTRINRRSRRRVEASDDRAVVRAQVFARDGHCCLLAGSTFGPCIGPLTVHHLWKEGQGGPYVAWNLITLCAGHNDGVEPMRRVDAEALGLVVARGQHMDDVWRRLAFAEIVVCWFDGTPLDQPQPALDIVRST